jgi:apolipoprotein N-acyltransferase
MVAGVFAAAALPPTYAVPLLLISFPCLIWLIDGAQTWRRAFWDGWWFGLGFFAAGLYWISYSLVVDFYFVWLIPFASLCIPGALGFYIAAGAALASLVPQGIVRIVVFTASWVFLEWLRGILFTGFPWNGIGLVWGFSEVAIQLVAYVGVLGLGLITVFGASSVAVIARGQSTTFWREFSPLFACIVTIFVVGFIRLGLSEKVHYHRDIHLRIVQPNIPQKLKWKKTLRDKHLATFLRLSLEPSSHPITQVIWPETAVPFIISHDTPRRLKMASVVPKNGLLLTGAIRTSARIQKPFKMWNSLYAVSEDGQIVITHDKFQLVPFGEYIPLGEFFRKYLRLKKITEGRTDFSAGPGPQTISLPNLPSFSPLICYEVIFPGSVVGPGRRPKWLLNITNDAWFGESSGPFQHFAMARIRAVEQGLPLIRAANTGISGVIDPFGRVIKRLALNTQGIVDSALPKPTRHQTVFSKVGEWPILALLFLMFSAPVLLRKKICRIKKL